MSSRNATASWSGYSHQGQVGILVAIKEMSRLMQSGLQDEFNIHFLEYENNEDVAISKLLPTTLKELISVHQVKAYYSQGHLLNTYRSVFTGAPIFEIGLDGKLLKDAQGNKIETGTFAPGQWCSGRNYLHTVQNIANWPVNDYTSVGGNPHNIIRYEYAPNIFHCGTEQISSYILNELNSQNFHNGNFALSNITLNRLSYILDEKIRNEHATKENKTLYDIKFSFIELHNIINDNSDIDDNNVFLSRKMFYDEFINKLKTNEVDDDNDHLEFLKSNIIQDLYSLNDNDFLNFLKKLNLNENYQHLDNPQYNFNVNGIRQVFLKILIEVKNLTPEILENSVQYVNTVDKLKYVLTAIISEADDKEIVISAILENLNSQNILWEEHALINKDITANFSENIPKINNIIMHYEDGDANDKFMSFTSKSKLIKRDDAKNILTNGTATV